MLCAQPTTHKWGSTMTLLMSKFSDPDRGEGSYLNGHAGLEPPKSLGTVASLQIVFCESSMKWFSSQTCNKIILWLPPSLPPPQPPDAPYINLICLYHKFLKYCGVRLSTKKSQGASLCVPSLGCWCRIVTHITPFHIRARRTSQEWQVHLSITTKLASFPKDTKPMRRGRTSSNPNRQKREQHPKWQYHSGGFPFFLLSWRYWPYKWNIAPQGGGKKGVDSCLVV